ncbi:MAG: serpin family protein [Clostridiales bacterium]|nr:serpin family protein [Clostridiales bacterium]
MIKRYCLVLLLLLVLSMTGCNQKDKSMELNNAQSVFQENSSTVYPLDRNVIKGINSSGSDIFQKIYEKENSGNVLFSPLSLASALSMLENGASGISQTEIMDVLNIESDERLNMTYNSLINHFSDISNHDQDYKTTVSLSNSFWFKENDLIVKDSYIDTIKEQYDGDIYSVDFNDETKNKMNGWIEDKTNGLLKNTIKEIDPLNVAYLINTLYFNGHWTSDFPKYATKVDDFYLSNGNTVPVQMMHNEDRYKYYESDDVQMIALNYSDAFMYVMLPKGSMDEFMSRNNQFQIEDWIDELDFKTVDLSFPRFKFSNKHDLKDILILLGMPSVFNGQTAEFRNMTDSDKVYVSRVFQNTTIEVDEEGTEAAAVTVMSMDTTAMPVEPEVIVMNCNKPFMFVIKDNLSGCDLFVGVVQNPLEE